MFFLSLTGTQRDTIFIDQRLIKRSNLHKKISYISNGNREIDNDILYIHNYACCSLGERQAEKDRIDAYI